MKLRLLTLGAMLLLTLSTLTAQRFSGDRECGYTGKSEWLERYQAGEIPRVGKSLMPQFVPLRIVILGDDDGNGYASLRTVFDAVKLVNEDFESLNTQFYIAGDIEYENDTRYYDHEDFSDGQQMMRRFNEDGVVNCYIVANPAGNCGYYNNTTSVRAGQGVALSRGCIGPGDHTWSHELGHYFSLPHTFVGWEGMDVDEQDWDSPAPAVVRFGRQVEKVDGSNCNVAADGFCDTPPDYLSDRWACTADGIYRDTLTDPMGERFTVPGWPIMSYALDNCVDSFSLEQQGAVLTNIAARGDEIANDYVPTPEPDHLEITHMSPAVNEDLEVYDQVEFRWTASENADFYLVELNDSRSFADEPNYFYLTQDTFITVNPVLRERFRYYWRVKPVNRYEVCAEFTEPTRFRTGTELTSTIDAAFDAALTVSPNPVGNGQELNISVRGTGFAGTLNYQLIDAAGRIVMDRQGITTVGTGFTERLNTTGLKPGVFFLRLLLNDRLVTRRVMVKP